MVVNTVQSTFAALLGYIYVLVTRKSANDMPIFPSRRIFWPLSLVAIVSSLSSPFGYASLAHVDYITFILAKSCKLVPVMLLHVTLYRKKYPFYKYAVVALVTTGVAVFTLHQSTGSKKKKGADGNSLYGLMLLGINLLFDGLTNSTQDDIYAKFRPYSGQQMMCALNMMSTVLTSGYLLVSPYLVHSGLGQYVGMDVKSAGELQEALAFISRHPNVGWDILAFAACGAMGQVFICLSTIVPLPINRRLTKRSHDSLDLWQPTPRHGDSDEEDADDDTLGPLVRAHLEWYAMAGRWAGVWRHWYRGRVEQAGKKGEGESEAGEEGVMAHRSSSDRFCLHISRLLYFSRRDLLHSSEEVLQAACYFLFDIVCIS